MTFDGASEYYSGQGVLMIGRKDPVTGEPMGLRPVGNVPDCKITNGSTVVEHKGSQDGQRATDARLQTEIKVGLSFTIESFDSKNLELALRGDDTAIAAGTATDEPLMGYPGLVTGLKHIKISSLVVKQGVTTLTPFVDADTPWDYKVNTEAGSIMLNDGSDVAFDQFTPASPSTDGVELTATYSYEKQHRVESLTQPLLEYWLRFEGLNTVDENKPVVIDIYRFSNDPIKELAMLSDTFQGGVVEGTVLKDDTRQTGSKYYNVKKQDKFNN